MKDKFFAFCERRHLKAYRIIMHFVYWIKSFKQCKNVTKLNHKEKIEIKKYWKKFHVRISTKEFAIYKRLGFHDLKKFIPETVWHSNIEPFYTDISMCKGFMDKNYFELILGKEFMPKTIIRCINDLILDENYKIKEYNKLDFLKSDKEFIIKPSLDSGGGRSIQFLHGKEFTIKKIEQLKKDYQKNFIVQEVLQQNQFLANFNESSLNTIRIITLITDNKVNIVSSVLRIGKKGKRVDNMHSGGLSVKISRKGVLGDYLIDEGLNKTILLENNFKYQGITVPYWDKIIEIVKKQALKINHFKLINRDFTLDLDGNVKIIEFNIIDSPIDYHQASKGPIFSDLTDFVLNEVFVNKGKRK